MSADSTELTFVRCPSCRSLVPALSKSCRMCGAVLDAAGKGDDAEAQQRRSGRVRQRTMSQGQDELSAAVSKLREEIPPVDAGTSTERSAGAPIEPPADDPLSAFVQEIEVQDATEVSEEAHAPKNGIGEIQTPNPFDDDELDALLTGERATRMAGAPAEVPPPAATPRVVVESGRRPHKGGLSFSKDREERQESRGSAERANVERGRREEQPRHERSRDEGAQKAPPRQEPRDVRREQDTRSDSKKVQWNEVPRKNVSGGRLCGWFVSFKDSDGRSIELREGKYFLTSRQIRDTDLVIEDRSISSPHAMLALAGDGKMRVQDLMSDRGIFLRRRGESEFTQLTEAAAEVNHGDLLRFGDLEVQVCLIAHIGDQ